MKSIFSLLFVCLLFLASCGSDDSGGTTGDDGTDDGGSDPVTATYRITFTPEFSVDSFPQDYPAGATFSGIVVAVHAAGSRVFQEGAQASDELKTLVETGDNAPLINFLNSQGGTDSSDFLVTSLSSAGGPEEAQTVTVTIDPEKTSISFLSALSPSPDWFVGVDGASLVENGNTLVDNLSISLVALDAGTDSGDTYEAPNDPTDPQGVITAIDVPPIADGSGFIPAMGTLSLTRTDL